MKGLPLDAPNSGRLAGNQDRPHARRQRPHRRGLMRPGARSGPPSGSRGISGRRIKISGQQRGETRPLLAVMPPLTRICLALGLEATALCQRMTCVRCSARSIRAGFMKVQKAIMPVMSAMV